MSNNLQIIDKTLIDAKSDIVTTIQQYQWDLIPETQLHAAKAALTKSKYIMDVAADNPEAVYDALIKGAILGVDLTESKRQAYLLPRRNSVGVTVIQLQIGYKGVEAIHQRMGVIDRLVIRVVHKNDEFDWSGDDSEKPKHNANWFGSEAERGEIIGAYSITYFPNEKFQVMTAPISEIYSKHRDISDSWRKYIVKKDKGENPFPPPWVTHEKTMIEKTMAFIASKQWPANIRNESASGKILETLHEVDYSDYRESFVKYTAEEKERFYDLLETNDALGIWQYYRYMIDNDKLETWIDLTNSFPKGKKMKYRQTARDLEKQGNQIEIALLKAIETDDELLFSETIAETSSASQRRFYSDLSEFEKDKFMSMIEATRTNNG